MPDMMKVKKKNVITGEIFPRRQPQCKALKNLTALENNPPYQLNPFKHYLPFLNKIITKPTLS